MTRTVVFTAADSAQRGHLLETVGRALDSSREVDYVIAKSYEGDQTSVYVFSFWDVGYVNGWRQGWRHGAKKALDADDFTRARYRNMFGMPSKPGRTKPKQRKSGRR